MKLKIMEDTRKGQCKETKSNLGGDSEKSKIKVICPSCHIYQGYILQPLAKIQIDDLFF